MIKLLQTFGFLLAFCTGSYATVVTVFNTNNSGIGSLREAIITAANNGDTIRFDPNLISGGSDTIILSTEIAFSKSLRIVGLYNSTDSLYISGNDSTRIFAITNTTKVTLDSLLLLKGNGQGAVSNGYGGAVLFLDSDSLFLNYSVLRKNSGTRGGGIYCDSNPSSIVITNSTINENTADAGGGFYSEDYNTSITIASSTICGNFANTDGGGIFSIGNNLTLSYLVLNNNTANNGGGGGLIHESYNAAPALNNCTIRNNTALSGGGIYNNYNGGMDSLKIINSTIIGNTATFGTATGNGGGGIYTKSAILLSNSTLNDNVAVTGNGGGIYSRPTSNFSLTLTNSTIIGNIAGSNGGGFFSSTNNLFGVVTTKIARSKICNNTANDNGGGFYLDYDPTSSSNIYNSSLEVSDSSVISNNSATNGFGGGFYLRTDNLDSSFSMTIENSIFSNNDAINQGGGGFFSKTDSPFSKVIVNNVTISDNTARFGGGCSIQTTYRDTIAITNSTISDNSASHVAGGFRIHFDYADSCSVTLNNLTITDNISGDDGGGIYISYYTTNFGILALTESNLTITGNTAAGLGGGIFHQIPSGSDIMLTSSIVAFNGISNIVNDFVAPPFTSGGYNVFDDAPTTAIGTDQINVTASQLNLQPLAYYGGITKTMLPGTGSVAINSGNPSDLTDAQNRPISGVRDAGAAESCTQTSYSTINPSVCNNYISPSGFYTWDSSGVYTDIIPNAFGCDSIITINLTVNNTSSIINPNTCSSYTSPSGNHTWSSSGIYIDTIPNTLGCDSIITINLSIDSSSSNITINACGSSYTSPSGNYTWSSNGIYLDTIPNALGCDSIITIDLTVNNSTYSSITPNSCDRYTSPSGNYTWVSSGNYADTIPNALGCDSIITINLTINPLPNVSISSFNPDTLCDTGNPVVLPVGTPSGGNYTGVGVVSSNFDPSIAGIGTHSVIYTFTDSNSCANSDTTSITVINCVGINEVTDNFDISIYPNPNTGLFTIEKPKNLNKEVKTKIFDVTNKLILDKIISRENQKVTIDITNYSKGIYYLQLIVDEKVITKQILKN